MEVTMPHSQVSFEREIASRESPLYGTNFDFGASFTPVQLEAGTTSYNFVTVDRGGEDR
jgi:hypothetical protein